MTWLTQFLQSLARPFQWWVVVAPWEQGLRIRLGRTAAILQPGIHLRLPFLDRVYVQSRRRRVVTKNNLTITTLDRIPLSIGFALEFGITDILALYQAVATPECILEQRICGAVAGLAARTRADDLSFDQMVQVGMEALRGTDNWGLEGLTLTITSIARARVLRLLMHDYRDSSGLYSLENGEGKGER